MTPFQYGLLIQVRAWRNQLLILRIDLQIGWLKLMILSSQFADLTEWWLKEKLSLWKEDREFKALLKKIKRGQAAYEKRRREYLIEKYLHPYKDE